MKKVIKISIRSWSCCMNSELMLLDKLEWKKYVLGIVFSMEIKISPKCFRGKLLINMIVEKGGIWVESIHLRIYALCGRSRGWCCCKIS